MATLEIFFFFFKDEIFLWGFYRRVPVATFGVDKRDANFLQNPLPCGGLRLQHHPNLSQWPNWIYALQ